MADIEFRPTPSDYVFTFGGVPPIRKVRAGDVLRLWSEDAFGGVLQRTTDRPTELLDTRYLNPQTGPFYVEDAEPGDTLVLHIVDLTPARDWAASTTIPFFGGLTSTDRTRTLQEPLPELTWIYQVDRTRQVALFESLRPVAGGEPFSVELPMEPMLGTVGVAPPLREVRTSLTPDNFGGNMDTPEMRAGATCYLPVNVPGALFSIGDGHYRQGEGESCGTAIEGAMNSTLIVELIKGQAPAWPRLENDEFLMTVGSTRPLEDAWRIGQVEMVHWLGELYGLDTLDAYQLLAQICLAPIANVVDANYSAVTKVRKSLLPARAAYGDVHRELRARAAEVG